MDYPHSPSTSPTAAQQWGHGNLPCYPYPIKTNVHQPGVDGHLAFANDAAAKWSETSAAPASLSTPPLSQPSSIHLPEENVWSAFTNLQSEGSTPQGMNPQAFLPGFIKPLPAMINPATLECLHLNGVFALANPPLQNALLGAFAECVLPSMPIVEWQNLFHAIHGGDGQHGSVSLLLYHAIMVSATTFVDIGYIVEAGFSSRQEAQESFFQKARLLYQANIESDSLIIVQSFLLMTYRLDTADGDDSRHLVGIAIPTALSIGLFQDVSQAINFPYRPTLWRRIAWACHVVDCQIALRLRRRPIIQRADFCHQMISEDDFELHHQNLAMAHELSPYHNFAAKRELALMFIANARLSVCIRNVLDVQCKESQLRASTSPATPTSAVSDDSDYSQSVFISERMLSEWANSLPVNFQTTPQNQEEEAAITVQRSLLHMTFYTTIAVFHQARPFPSSNFCVQHASRQITLVAFDLHRRNLHRRLPIVGVTGILVALVIHISEMKAPPSPQKDEATKNFQLGLEMMASLRDVYSEANRVTSWALKFIQQTSVLSDSPLHGFQSQNRGFGKASGMLQSVGSAESIGSASE
ncbi:hypothetical protein N7532_002026 [Penicillium argentinense]|uniref:Xylanolytic transcriptional activator regulatory domain-containing protein n=1 Tax=Penicillium argentinense TaxID=1131581 RepID=A0A9W9G3K7_9EURO|nr:uncharacterized protein N7532_002026 [Penicillium argentinense]KAJ5111491.1 hypothetical protein N7532_002026 [Penicillium argentinense]